MSNTVSWLNNEFSVHQHGDNWSAVAGLYIFAGRNSQGQWVPLYIGQAGSLAERIPTHERWQEAAKLGATHVHAKVVSLQATRDSLEKQLIQAFQPRLNTQLR
jgi:excinuclease UvrABC nuclease subunit